MVSHFVRNFGYSLEFWYCQRKVLVQLLSKSISSILFLSWYDIISIISLIIGYYILFNISQIIYLSRAHIGQIICHWTRFTYAVDITNPDLVKM